MHSDVEHLRRKSLQLCSSIAARFDEIESADYPLASPKELIVLFSQILSAIEKKIRIVSSVNELVVAQRLLEFYSSLFQFFDGANIERTPRALVKTIEFLIKVISSDATVLPSPIHEYNYSIVEIGGPILKAVEHFIPDIQKDFPFKGPVNCISFPYVERDNILMHTVLGHEIGHPIADEFLDDDEESKAFKSKQENTVEEIRALVDNNSPEKPLFAFQQQQVCLTRVLKIRRRALEEIISDCVSVMLYGPSAMFAMNDLLSNDLDSPPAPPRFYPPSRMRLRYIYKIMCDKKYVDTIMAMVDKGSTVSLCIESTKEFLSHIKSITETTDDQSAVEKDALCKIAFEWVILSMNDALEFLNERLKSVNYDAVLISNQVPELLMRLGLGIPPNEIGSPDNIQTVDWRSSMLAGWMYNIAGITVPYDSNENVNAHHHEIINRLTMKSIEYSLLANDYQTNTDSKLEET